jgi:hypothetical protein
LAGIRHKLHERSWRMTGVRMKASNAATTRGGRRIALVLGLALIRQRRSNESVAVDGVPHDLAVGSAGTAESVWRSTPNSTSKREGGPMAPPLTNSDPSPRLDNPSERTSQFGEEVLDRTSQATTATVDAVKEHPMATLAIVAGIAFAIGALWKIGSSRRATTMDSLLARFGELQDQLPRRWRT